MRVCGALQIVVRIRCRRCFLKLDLGALGTVENLSNAPYAFRACATCLLFEYRDACR